jgi:hypothetical protein
MICLSNKQDLDNQNLKKIDSSGSGEHTDPGGHGHVGGHHRAVPHANSHHRTMDVAKG